MSSGLIRFFAASLLAVAAVVPSCGPCSAAGAGHGSFSPRAGRPIANTRGSAGGSKRRRLHRPRPQSRAKRLPLRILHPPLQRAPALPGPRLRARASTGENVDLPARPFAYIEGKADKDEIYSAILNSLSSVKRDMDKANLAPAGRPIAVFVESDDTGF